MLDRRFQAIEKTELGPATRLAHYFYIVCLPTRDGGWTAVAGDDIDQEAAETRFVGYAWPVASGHGLDRTFFIDEDERILEHLEPEEPNQETPAFLGPAGAPRCDEALTHPEQWSPWRGKASRQERRADAR